MPNIYGFTQVYHTNTQGGGWEDTVGDIIEIGEGVVGVVSDIEELFGGDNGVGQTIEREIESGKETIGKMAITEWIKSNWLLILLISAIAVMFIFALRK